MTFFKNEDYKLPVSSNYMKFLEGDNTFRVMSSAIVGWEYWNTDNKPVRSPEPFEEVPQDIKKDKDGNNTRINHFWAFCVWNYEAQKIQVLELTQKGLMKAIKGYVDNKKWGDPKNFDLTVNRTGSGFDTEYQITPNPHSEVLGEIKMAYEAKTINLDNLFSGQDPFKS